MIEPTEVPCPYCGVERNEPCKFKGVPWREGEPYTAIHAARRRAANQVVQS